MTGDAVGTIAQLPDECTDLLFFDPPYVATAAEWDRPVNWKSFGQEALRILKPTGQAFSFANFNLAIALRRALPLKFRYETVIRTTSGVGVCYAAHRQPTRVHEYGLIWCHPDANIKALAWNEIYLYTKATAHKTSGSPGEIRTHGITRTTEYKDNGTRRPVSVMGMKAKCNLVQVERTSHMAQKEFRFCAKWIGALSNKGDLVVDPFVGTGTITAAAAHLGRGFFGCDIQEYWAEFAAERAQRAMEATIRG